MVQIKFSSNQSPKVSKKKKVTFAKSPAESNGSRKLKVERSKRLQVRKSKKAVQMDVNIDTLVKNERVAARSEDDEDYQPVDSGGEQDFDEEENDLNKALSTEATKRRRITSSNLMITNQTSKKMMVVSQESPKRKGRKRIGIETHIHPGGVVELVKGFNEDQLKSVDEIGFGGLCTMKLTKFNRDMVPWLVHHFNPISQRFSVDGANFNVTRDDIFDLFCLPKGDIKVVHIEKFRKRENPDDSYIEDLKRNFVVNGDNTVPTGALVKSMMDLKEGGPLFKKFFILFVCSTFLNPSANGTVDFYIAKAIHDVDSIKNLDWCSYVLSSLCSAVKAYFASVEKAKKEGRTVEFKRVKGCVLVLELLYFHRFMFRGEKEPSDIPLIQHWTNDKLHKRMVEEKEAGFGDCDMDKKTYPVCMNLKSKVVNHQSTKPSISSLKRIIQFELPDGLFTDEEINSIAEDEIQRILLLLKRDIDLFNLIHVERLNRIKDMIKERDVNKSDLEKASQSPVVSQTDKILSDPITLKQIDNIVNNFYMMKNMAMSIPSFELLSEEPSQKDCTGIGDEELENLNCEDGNKELNLTYDLLSLMCSFDCGAPSDAVELVSDHMSRNKDHMRILPSLQQEVVDYSMFKIPGKEDTDFKKFGISHLETLFNFNGDEYVISRQEMLTLAFHQKVSSAVIRVWSLLLNDVERKKKSEDKWFFFGTDHMVYFQNMVKTFDETTNREKAMIKKIDSNLQNSLKAWVTKTANSLDHLLEATMIFVPMLMEDHYFCFVINFNSKSVQYLDNRKYTKAGLDRFTNWALCMVKKLSFTLKKLNDKRSSLISSFKVEVVPFHWQSWQTNLDCGVFMMMHMMFFK